jgi:hypothetical protein
MLSLPIRRVRKSRAYELPPPHFIHVYASLFVEGFKAQKFFQIEFAQVWLPLAKMLSGVNAFDISDIQEAETEGTLTRQSGCNNVALR